MADKTTQKEYLQDLILEVMQTNETSAKIEKSLLQTNSYLNNVDANTWAVSDQLFDLVKELTGGKLDQIERDKESAKYNNSLLQSMRNIEASVKVDTTKSSKDDKGSSGKGGGFLSKLGGSLMGMVGIAAGVAGFMAALSVGSAGLDWLKPNYSGLGKAFKSFSDAIVQLSPMAMVALAGVAAIASKTSLKNSVGLGLSMTSVGAGIVGFLLGLSAGDKALSWAGTDYSSVGKAFKSFSTAITNLSTEAVMLVGGIAAIALANASFGGTPAKLALGMAAVAAGIAGFLGGLVLADGGLSWLTASSGADGSGLKSAFTMFSDSIEALSPKAIIALGGLLAGAALLGKVNPVSLALNMTAVAAGIAGFMGGLLLGETGMSWISAIPTGGSGGMVAGFELFNDLVNALDPGSIIALGAIIAATAAIGTGAAGGIVAGMTALGLGIAGFIGGISLGDKFAALLSAGGQPGESLKILLTNIFEGISGAKILSGVDLIGIGAGIATIGGGLAVFAAGTFVSGLANVGTALLKFFGGDSAFDQIIKIADKSEQLERGGNALMKIADALNKFSSIKVGGIDLDFEELAKDLGSAIQFLEALAKGGKIKGGFFKGDVDFGKGILDPSLRLDELAEASKKINAVLNKGTYNNSGDTISDSKSSERNTETAAKIVTDGATLNPPHSTSNNSSSRTGPTNNTVMNISNGKLPDRTDWTVGGGWGVAP